MAHKKEDEIMAEYLLKGGKMLEKTCRQCGCPLFDYKGKTFCVVCTELGKDEGKEQAGEDAAVPAAAGTGPGAPAPAGTAALADELVSTVLELLRKIRTEEDPDRCSALMESVKTGIEALSCLRQL
jgi:UPF0148 protein